MRAFAIPTTSVRRRISRFKLLYGDKDVPSPLTVAEDLAAKISTSRLVIVPGAGHLCDVEGSDRFNAAVRSFLRSPQI